MNQKKTSSWLAAYLYYNEPWERFLKEAVLPYSQIVLSTGIAESFFFIRYWDRGPHIRLRFKADQELIEKILRPNLEEHFLNYFDSVPSFRMDPPYPARIPESYKWHPNNTVQYDIYEPEIDRYGGAHGMALAEQQFGLSSKIVLQTLLAKAQQWSYDDALGTAIKLHLSFVHAAGMNREEATAFFAFFFENWLPQSFSLNPAMTDALSYHQEKQKTLTAFTDAFEVQKESLVHFHRILWNGLKKDDQAFEEELLTEWVRENKKILLSLQKADRNKLLTPRSEKYKYNNSTTESFGQAIWDHYADYMHMTNNRLGIHNKDEGYLGYLMMRSMEVIEQAEEEEGRSDGRPPGVHFFNSFG